MSDEKQSSVTIIRGGDPLPEEQRLPDSLDRSAALKNSINFDVHRWSDHPEVNSFVDVIYKEHFSGGKTNIRRKHLKVLLLDVYVNWCEDPDKKIAISRNNNDYLAGTRYNELKVSRATIDVVDVLLETGLIEQAIGFRNPEDQSGRLSRIWPTDRLMRLFQEARFSPLDVYSHSERLTVILRDKDEDSPKNKEIEYEPSTETERMSDVLSDYNQLLRSTFIDIPTLEASKLSSDQNGSGDILTISQNDKFVRRIFSRGSFECGGRFYGGWWQRCPKELRKLIFMNDRPTNEVDFSGLHIVMLYAEKGISYWNTASDDPYGIPVLDFLVDEQQARSVAKRLMLMMLNARTQEEAFKAFRLKSPAESEEKRYSNDQLVLVTNELKALHPDIRDAFGTDVGIRLQNRDSHIASNVIQNFVGRQVPVLSMHDSFIVPAGYEEWLAEIMVEAFEIEMSVPLPMEFMRTVKLQSETIADLENQLHSGISFSEQDWYKELESVYRKRTKPKKTKRYSSSLESFRDWVSRA